MYIQPAQLNKKCHNSPTSTANSQCFEQYGNWAYSYAELAIVFGANNTIS